MGQTDLREWTALSTPCPVSREQTQAKLDLRAAAASRHKASQTYCTAERFEEAVRKHGERPCLAYRDERYSYAEANSRINQTAHALHGLGVRRGDVVALCDGEPSGVLLRLVRTGQARRHGGLPQHDMSAANALAHA
jgi:non-ribosomal peptide synthetase component F